MEKIINTSLFSVSNIIAIGAIMLFWAMVAYALNFSFTGGQQSS